MDNPCPVFGENFIDTVENTSVRPRHSPPTRLLVLPLIATIRCYQVLFSPDHSRLGRLVFPYGFCRYSPSCSEYARRAMMRYGVVHGMVKALWRILRCNPWSLGGVDDP